MVKIMENPIKMGHYITNPNSALLQWKSLKSTIQFSNKFDPPKMGPI